MIHLTDQPIDVARLMDQGCTAAAGAVLVFLGITRQFTVGQQDLESPDGGSPDGGSPDGGSKGLHGNGVLRETVMLQYDAYHTMAEQELAQLVQEACKRWNLVDCQVVHRLGIVPLAEISVAIVVSSAHRRVAFAAGEWLIDTLKARVPIWKKECWADGRSEWVHPESK